MGANYCEEWQVPARLYSRLRLPLLQSNKKTITGHFKNIAWWVRDYERHCTRPYTFPRSICGCCIHTHTPVVTSSSFNCVYQIYIWSCRGNQFICMSKVNVLWTWCFKHKLSIQRNVYSILRMHFKYWRVKNWGRHDPRVSHVRQLQGHLNVPFLTLQVTRRACISTMHAARAGQPALSRWCHLFVFQG